MPNINFCHDLHYQHLYQISCEELESLFSQLKQSECLLDAFNASLSPSAPALQAEATNTDLLSELNKRQNTLTSLQKQMLVIFQSHDAKDTKLQDIQLIYTSLDLSLNHLRPKQAPAFKAIPSFISTLVLHKDAIQDDSGYKKAEQADVDRLKAFFTNIPATVATIDLSDNGKLLSKFNAKQLKEIFASLPKTVKTITAHNILPPVPNYYSHDIKLVFNKCADIIDSLPMHARIEGNFSDQYDGLKVSLIGFMCEDYLRRLRKDLDKTIMGERCRITIETFATEEVNSDSKMTDYVKDNCKDNPSQEVLLRKYYLVKKLYGQVVAAQLDSKLSHKQQLDGVKQYLATHKLQLLEHRNNVFFAKLLNAVSGVLLMVHRAVFYTTNANSVKHPLFWRSHSEQLMANIETIVDRPTVKK